jgi:serine/threonine-protein kinase
MAIPSVSQLVEVVHEHSLLAPEQAGQLAELQQQCKEARDLARELVSRGLLSAFQVERLLLGRVEDLNIGPYLLLDAVGEGAMGQVFKARHREKGHIVALKVVREDHQGDARTRRRFRREIRAMKRLTHINIVTARDIDEIKIKRTRFFAMEYVDGVNLHQVLKECVALPLAPALDYVRQAANGLQHAYERGLIHRDIKPANFLITPPPRSEERTLRPGRWGVVKLLDMGLALLHYTPEEKLDSKPHLLTGKGMMLGTVDYVAPEQIMNPHEVDIRADLYSLGCTFYEMLTGQVPFTHGSPARKLVAHQEQEPLPITQLRPELPEEVALVVHKLMAKAPAARFQTPAHLTSTLTTILNRLPPEQIEWDWRPPHLEGYSSAASLSHLTGDGGERHWWPLAVGVLVMVAAALALVLLFWNSGS